MTIYDLTHRFNAQTPPYPGEKPAELTLDRSLTTDGYNAYTLHACFHTGTHIDMPMHFLNDPAFASDYALDLFAGPGVLLDVRGQNPVRYRDEWENMVSEGSVVLLYTGFGEKYSDPGYFTSYPAVDLDLAGFFVKKKIKMLGIDAASPDYFPFNVHKLLLANRIFILENLTNLGVLLNIPSFTVFAPPLKIDAEASLVRAFAVV